MRQYVFVTICEKCLANITAMHLCFDSPKLTFLTVIASLILVPCKALSECVFVYERPPQLRLGSLLCIYILVKSISHENTNLATKMKAAWSDM